MSENVKFDCACDTGYDKGVLKKTLENNIFTIFGNLNERNSIVIRYHGVLTENILENSPKFNMFFYFDEAENDKKIITLQKCAKCLGDCYCATIDLDNHHSLNFGFSDENNNYELNNHKPFRLNIDPDPISDLMQRYGFEQNSNLPTCGTNKEKMFTSDNILNIIKKFFANIFKSKGQTLSQ